MNLCVRGGCAQFVSGDWPLGGAVVESSSAAELAEKRVSFRRQEAKLRMLEKIGPCWLDSPGFPFLPSSQLKLALRSRTACIPPNVEAAARSVPPVDYLDHWLKDHHHSPCSRT